MVADEVADTLKAVILCPNLRSGKEGVNSGEESSKTSAPRLQKWEYSRGLRKGKRTGSAVVPITEASLER